MLRVRFSLICIKHTGFCVSLDFPSLSFAPQRSKPNPTRPSNCNCNSNPPKAFISHCFYNLYFAFIGVVPYEEERFVFLIYNKFAKKKKKKREKRVMALSGLLVAVTLFQARTQCPFLLFLLFLLSLMGGFLFESVPSYFWLLFFLFFYF
jgi:hypothetical protein